MEYFEAKNLQSILDSCKIDFLHRLHILCDISNALRFCHANKIIHLDLKPQNVLISLEQCSNTKGYCCKLSDFGCSVMLDFQYFRNRSLGVSRINLVKFGKFNFSLFFQGTARYSAPEVLQNSTIDCFADIFSLAIIMWQMKEVELPYGSIYSNEIIIWNVVKNNLRPDSIDSSSPKIKSTLQVNEKKSCKTEIKFLQVEKFISSPLTPKSYNRGSELIPKIINKTLKLQEKTLYGSNQKNRIRKSRTSLESCRKLFTNLQSVPSVIETSEQNFIDCFIDTHIYAPDKILLLESEYIKIYKHCWSQDPSTRYSADEICKSLNNMITLLM
jgi:serine/threonine protein kinase